jgi:hypothetical protein
MTSFSTSKPLISRSIHSNFEALPGNGIYHPF